MDLQNRLEDIKNKLLRHSFQQEREDQQQIENLQQDIRPNHNEEHLNQQIITLEGDKDYIIQQPPSLQNNHSSLSQKINNLISSSQQDESSTANNNANSNNNNNIIPLIGNYNNNMNNIILNNDNNNPPLQDQNNGLNQPHIDVQIMSSQGGLDALLNEIKKFDIQALRVQQEVQAQNENENTEEQKYQDESNDNSNNPQLVNNSSIANSLKNRLIVVSKVQQTMLSHLSRLKKTEFENSLEELNGSFWQNLYLKMKHYHKLIITQFLYQMAFLLTTCYYSFRQFNMEMLGAKLILMYMVKNFAQLYLINQYMKIINQKIEDYEKLKEKLGEYSKKFQLQIEKMIGNQETLQTHIDLINNENLQEQLEHEESKNLVQQIFQMFGGQNVQVMREGGLQKQNERTEQLINKATESMVEVIVFLQELKDNFEFKMELLEIDLLKRNIFQFSNNFMPFDTFLQQTQKQSMSRIEQAILRQNTAVLFMSYLMKMVVIALTVMNCMIIFTNASESISSIFLIMLWMNLIHDHIQVFALTILLVILIAFFIGFFVFTRSVYFIKRYKHKQKLKLRLSSLKKSIFVNSDNPEITKECCICLNEYQNNDVVVTLNCDVKHVFHQNCIETWANQKDECPFCRSSIFN